MSNIQGADQLKARLKAIRTKVAGPAAKAWQAEAVGLARDYVGSMNMPYSDGNLLGSIDAKRTGTGKISSTNYKAVVVASYHSYFVSAGVKPHSMTARASTQRRAAKQGRTIFSRKGRKHPGYKARPFRERTLMNAYDRHPVRDYVVKAWNEAA